MLQRTQDDELSEFPDSACYGDFFVWLTSSIISQVSFEVGKRSPTPIGDGGAGRPPLRSLSPYLFLLAKKEVEAIKAWNTKVETDKEVLKLLNSYLVYTSVI